MKKKVYKVGDEFVGFRFESFKFKYDDKYPLNYHYSFDKFIGKTGKIKEVSKMLVRVLFDGLGSMYYPINQPNLPSDGKPKPKAPETEFEGGHYNAELNVTVFPNLPKCTAWDKEDDKQEGLLLNIRHHEGGRCIYIIMYKNRVTDAYENCTPYQEPKQLKKKTIKDIEEVYGVDFEQIKIEVK